jgi:hypothetical protein
VSGTDRSSQALKAEVRSAVLIHARHESGGVTSTRIAVVEIRLGLSQERFSEVGGDRGRGSRACFSLAGHTFREATDHAADQVTLLLRSGHEPLSTAFFNSVPTVSLRPGGTAFNA